jgi:hypothetical protein
MAVPGVAVDPALIMNPALIKAGSSEIKAVRYAKTATNATTGIVITVTFNEAGTYLLAVQYNKFTGSSSSNTQISDVSVWTSSTSQQNGATVVYEPSSSTTGWTVNVIETPVGGCRIYGTTGNTSARGNIMTVVVIGTWSTDPTFS